MQVVAEGSSSKAARIADRHERSNRRKWNLAKKLTDPEKLVACISFYVHRLRPGKPVLAEPIDAELRAKGKSWRPYGKAARRVLGVKYTDGRRLMQLPKNVWDVRLPRIGLDLRFKPAQLGRFKAVNRELAIDGAVKSFAADYPQLLEKVQLRLQDRHRPTLRERLTGDAQLRYAAQDTREARKAAERDAQKKNQFWMPRDDDEPVSYQSLWDALAGPPAVKVKTEIIDFARLDEEANEVARIRADRNRFTGIKHGVECRPAVIPRDDIESPFNRAPGVPPEWKGGEELFRAWQAQQVAEMIGDRGENWDGPQGDDNDDEELKELRRKVEALGYETVMRQAEIQNDAKWERERQRSKERVKRQRETPAVFIPPTHGALASDCIGSWLEERQEDAERANAQKPEPPPILTFNWFQAPVSRPAPPVFPLQVPQEQMLLARVAAFLRPKAG